MIKKIILLILITFSLNAFEIDSIVISRNKNVYYFADNSSILFIKDPNLEIGKHYNIKSKWHTLKIEVKNDI